ncbi:MULTISPECIES: SDR family NAD(P)-dependent oxidoreductase [unclassified Pseudomonas]|uniref:SDR family NAD(P)-dependent oxidoreductase n=1 Tax=unclassified Pseudomonas TaxID=196821 RepID=UPI000C88DE28|nr:MULTISPECIES: SDR family oxidoreductase [unclassified Pseudomonas]PMX27455.1 3-oxoacyl-ACP reductase [Pseudomonas sp. GW460-12]PMX34477.1 3-oxoacyl-ACP reductase [Pseudomonas sp. MPR-R2A4]PMX41884.1 3-oxoacyl-ACP reductase [Pseudomonas sp. MPR-R2A7]PMX53840.1 3-oxoacyl-ACP reductase [Pseudomonas sp. MPR-R2A6]PMX91321.1 3-oxoacyl-ACP reductase [Pseudomonas sp. MPR-R2A3]
MRPLVGRTAFVTGGSKGIGAAIVRRLAADGARVIIAAQEMIMAELLADEVGGRAVRLDVTDLREVQKVVTNNGPFDILVNNAGVDQHSFFTNSTELQWRHLLAVNLEAVFATTHAALPFMQERGYGRIINIGSEAGRQGSKGGAVYAAAKGGVIAFTKSIARENGRFGITANVVAPGPIDTPLLRKAVVTGGEKLLEAMKAATLLGRLGTPDEVAAAVAFLASEEAAFITGETLGVSGGMGC